MSQQRLIAISLLILTVIIVAAAVANFFIPKQKPLPQLTSSPLPAPHFPTFNAVKSSPTYTTPVLNISFPTSIPNYKISQPVDPLGFAKSLAQKMNFSSEPQVLNAPQGIYYFWSTPDSSFTAGGSAYNISYNKTSLNNNLPSALTDTDNTYALTAQSLLTDLGVVPVDTTLSAPEFEYLAFVPNDFESHSVSRDKANVIYIKYMLNVNSLPILTGFPNTPTFSFEFDGNKNLISFSLNYYAVNKSGSTLNIVPLTEAVSNLQNNQGRLLYAFSEADKNQLKINEYTFDVVTIKSVSLAYYYTPGQESLLPVFVFSGQAQDKKTGNVVDTLSLISAVK